MTLQTASPTFENLAYGTHPRQCLDLWVADPRPSPVVLSVYGGGWSKGNKEKTREGRTVNAFLSEGISVAAINYRHLDDTPFPGPFLDTARAVQFLRFNQNSYGIDGRRIGAFGSSAGGVNVLWTAFSPDLANAMEVDPVGRESSRLSCVFAQNTPTFLDPESLQAKIPGLPHQHPSWEQALGPEGFFNPRAREILREASALYLVHSDAPPVGLSYQELNIKYPDPKPGSGVHHPNFGAPLIERLTELGVECQCLYHDNFPMLENPEFHNLMMTERLQFFCRHLKGVGC